jgi:hypothetical protein
VEILKIRTIPTPNLFFSVSSSSLCVSVVQKGGLVIEASKICGEPFLLSICRGRIGDGDITAPFPIATGREIPTIRPQ